MKLLEVLQEGRFRRLGGHEAIPVDTRLLATTRVDLEQAVFERRFRADLYYLISAIHVLVPPLRERREDLAPLAQFLLQKHASRSASIPPPLSPAFEEAMLGYFWPGNVRELESVMLRYLIFGDFPAIEGGAARSDTRHWSSVLHGPATT